MINSRKPQETTQATKSNTSTVHVSVDHSPTHKPIDAAFPDAVQKEVVLRQAWLTAWYEAHDQEITLSSYVPTKTDNEQTIDDLELSCVKTLEAIAALKAAN